MTRVALRTNRIGSFAGRKLLGFQLHPTWSIVVGIFLILLQGIVALAGIALVLMGLISLIKNLFRGKRTRRR